MKDMERDMRYEDNKKNVDNKKVKTKKKDSSRFLFEMIGRIIPKG